MRIDRTRFLLLTTTLAASTAAAVISTTGCSSTTNDTDAGTSSGGVSGPSGNTDSGPTTEGGNVDGGGDGGGDAGSCLGSAVTEGGNPDCTASTDDGGTGAKCVTGCTEASTNFKAEVAKAVNDCFNSGSFLGEPACEGNITCGREAVAKACPDPMMEAICAGVIAQCHLGQAITAEDCNQVVSALNVTGRTAFTSCVNSSGDCSGCLEHARNPWNPFNPLGG